VSEGVRLRPVIVGGSLDSNFLSSNPPEMLFGLGNAQLQRLRIRWLGGSENALGPPPGVRAVTITAQLVFADGME